MSINDLLSGKKEYNHQIVEISIEHKIPKFRRFDYVREMFRHYKSSAKNRKHSFNLSERWFRLNWNGRCAYCGRRINGIGIDRIDSEKGYDYDNVVLCCAVCNRMKLNYSVEQFFENCKLVVIHNKL
jgi:hypothetical protein